jgi:hypothetical protein
MFWSFWGKGTIVAISYLFLSLNFFIRILQRRDRNERITQRKLEPHVEAILSGLFTGIACLYHISAFIFVDIIVFFSLVEFLVSRRTLKKLLVPLGVFLTIGISFTLIFWLSRELIFSSLIRSPDPFLVRGDDYLFVKAPIIQGILYPFLFHYIPSPHHRLPLPIQVTYALFLFGTAILFLLALFSVFFDKSWTKHTEKRLLLCGFVVTYLMPLHPILTLGVFYFIPNRFLIYLEVFSALLALSSLNRNFVNRINRCPPFLFIIWLLILLFTFRWYFYALWFTGYY